MPVAVVTHALIGSSFMAVARAAPPAVSMPPASKPAATRATDRPVDLIFAIMVLLMVNGDHLLAMIHPMAKEVQG
jgi:hypothetical protein